MKTGAFALGAAALTLCLAIAGQAREQKVEGLKPVRDFAGIADPAARSVALFTEMGKVIQHPRCVNCHPRTDRPLQGDAQELHNPPVSRGPKDHGMAGLECGTCHGPANVALTNGRSVPGHPEWHVAPIGMAWEGKTLGQICQQIRDRKRNGGKSLEQIVEHNAHDGLVGWGWNPGPGRAPVPGTQAQFGELTRAWVASGAKCPTG